MKNQNESRGELKDEAELFNFYTYRVAGRNRNHRDFGVDVIARTEQSTRIGAGNCV